MNSSVNEWIEKAEEDYRVALTLRRLRRHPTHNAVCFHAQPCVEKYLKAILEKHGAVIRTPSIRCRPGGTSSGCACSTCRSMR